MLVFGVNAALHRGESERKTSVARVAPVDASTDSEAQIAQDNKMLMAVDEALRDEGPSPVEVYALQRLAAQRAARGESAAGHGKVTNQ
jgi:hypothetical protein